MEECSSRGNSTREGPGVAEHMACQRNCSNSVLWKQRAAGGMHSDEAGGMGKGTRLLSPDSGLCHPVPGRSRDVGPVNSAVWEFTEQNQFFLPPSSWLVFPPQPPRLPRALFPNLGLASFPSRRVVLPLFLGAPADRCPPRCRGKPALSGKIPLAGQSPFLVRAI